MNNPITAIYLKKQWVLDAWEAVKEDVIRDGRIFFTTGTGTETGTKTTGTTGTETGTCPSLDVIIRYFKACGISTKLDGSEDALIHCLKEGNGMPGG
ncbi:hypothetical protein AAVH_26762, partial [Aphelenchoides avenae]